MAHLDTLEVVALLEDLPERGLTRGQVGTVVERLDAATVEVEFSDDEGRCYALVPLPEGKLLALKYRPNAAA